MKFIILAAGRGYGMDSMTADKPKCMLPIGSETILDRQLRIFKQCHIHEEDIIVVVGYQKDHIKLPGKIQKLVNEQYETTGNAYSLMLALAKIDDDAIVFDGDIIFEKDIVDQLLKCEGNYLAALNKKTGYGLTGIKTNSYGRVTEIGKHVATSITYASIMKLDKKDLNLIKKEMTCSLYKKDWYTIPIGHVLNTVIFNSLIIEQLFFEINSYTDYIEAQKKLGGGDTSILLTGASGFLGKKLYHILKRNYSIKGIKASSPDSEFTCIDITKQEELEAFVSLTHPDIVIHSAGIADPDICEKNRKYAELVNVQATKNVVSICKKWNIKLIHISTDYVFDGDKESEYEKDSQRNPKNYYGRTKVQAEDIVREYKNSLIVRIPIIYGYNDAADKGTFPTVVLRKLEKNMEVLADNQQIRYPVLIDEVAFAIEKALYKKGTMHISSCHGVTKYQWAKILAETWGYDSSLVKEKNGTLEKRPLHVKLKIGADDYQASAIEDGTKILRKQMNCIFKLIYKSMPNHSIYGKNVGEYRYLLGKALGRRIPGHIIEKLDYVVPVPASGLFYAMGLAEEIRVPYLQALVKPDTNARSFQIADLALREKVIQDKIYAIPELLKSKTIALVDEAIFTGTTLRVVCDMMRACGVKEIYICIPTPVCRNVCKQYIQPERKLLIDQKGKKKFEEYFNVQEVLFQDTDNFIDSINELKQVCFECFQS